MDSTNCRKAWNEIGILRLNYIYLRKKARQQGSFVFGEGG